MKPMLASDAVEDKIKYPCIIQPKIDGCRGLNLSGTLTGRSLKTHANKHTTDFFSGNVFIGLDGEMAADLDQCRDDLCRITSSVLSRKEGEPFIVWWLFDYVNDFTKELSYLERLEILDERFVFIVETYPEFTTNLKLVPWVMCHNIEQLLSQEEEWLEMGYEGLIIRDPEGRHKQGRSTVKEGGLLRIKRFIEEEAIVINIVEGEVNNNEKQVNELGKSFRSSHKENKVPNGMLATLTCAVLKDIYDPIRKDKLLFAKGQEITVNSGKMTHKERVNYLNDQSLIIGKVIKFTSFPKGIKDKPRFPQFQAIRSKEDM